MAAISTLAAYMQAIQRRTQRVDYTWNTLTAIAGGSSSLWRAGPITGTAPGAASNPSSTADGALKQLDGGSGQQWLARMAVGNSAVGTLMIADRLATIGGLVGNVNTSQTANSAALTRYTNGNGVMLGVEISTQIGTTATTGTVTYVDAESAASATSQAFTIGGTNFREAGRFLHVGLDNQVSTSADLNGFVSHSAFQLAASTGTAGDIALVLYKPLLLMPIHAHADPAMYDALISHGSNLPEILDGACLFGVCWSSTGGTGVIMPHLDFIET